MKLSDFDYELPKDLVAQYPADRRDESRLLVLDRKRNDLRETHFTNFYRFLEEGDVLVLNETKVFPARIFGRKQSGGGEVEIFLVRKIEEGLWMAMLRPARRLHEGDRVLVGEDELPVKIERRSAPGEWLVRLPASPLDGEFIRHHGHVPLPPYIKRMDELKDAERYQTVFARWEGSVAAPTAGLHFTDELLRKIKRRGVTFLPLALHIGPGTFRPLADESVSENRLDSEYVIIKQIYWDEIWRARSEGRRIVAVGTTTTRALESIAAGILADVEERVIEGESYISGWTDLFIYPGFKFRIVDSLLTNFHLPRSSLLLLVTAFAGRAEVLKTYRWAISRRFRFYSYGDAMLIR